MSLIGRLRPDSAIERTATRALMLARAPRPASSSPPALSALRRALRATALGRLAAPEREWIARIHSRRAEVAAKEAREYAAPATGGEADEIAGYLAASAEPWSVPVLWGEFMLRLVRELAPRSCVELGTGFGASALYVGAALELNGAGRLVTLDREERLRPVAERGFAALGLAHRIEALTGEIEETLGPALDTAAPVDLAIVDAEHTEEATVAHFLALAPGLAPCAIVVVDDINLSDGMRRAWTRIRAHGAAEVTLNLHRLGVVVTGGAGRT